MQHPNRNSPIEMIERLQLDERKSRFILDLQDNPPNPNAKLRAAARSLARRNDEAASTT
ncbi:MAG: DUF1778 domain-containing protein [Novosphingobium sp.]